MATSKLVTAKSELRAMTKQESAQFILKYIRRLLGGEHFGCIDDREDAMLGTPGGALGLLFSIVSVLKKVDLIIDIETIGKSLIYLLGGRDKFFIHSDEAHVDGSACEGCAHVQAVMANPSLYGLEKQDIMQIMRWLETQIKEIMPINHKILTGQHNSLTILDIHSKKWTIDRKNDVNAVFFKNSYAENLLFCRAAKYLVNDFNLNIDPKILGRMMIGESTNGFYQTVKALKSTSAEITVHGFDVDDNKNILDHAVIGV